MENPSQFVLDYVKKEGALHADIATIETLAGGFPLTGLTCGNCSLIRRSDKDIGKSVTR